MRMRHSWQLSAAIALSTLVLSGCGKKEEAWVPNTTALQADKSGKITETIVDSLDQTYYNGQELQSMIDSSVAEYDQQAGADAVTVTSSQIENGSVRVQMDYKSAADVAGYNNMPFYNGSMIGAAMEGYLFYNEFYKVTKEGVSSETITNEEPLSHKEYKVLISDLNHEVEVPGKVVYFSANAELTGERRVKPAESAVKADVDSLVLPSSTEQLGGDALKAAEDQEKTYIYIIYEF